MKLFKYVASIDAVKNIIDGKIKFATLESLNDPTELLPRIYDEELLESLQRKRDEGYTNDDLIQLKKQENLFNRLSPETKIIDAPKSINIANRIIQSSVYDNISYLKNQLNATAELMSSRCGIFCLSTRNDSLPIWARYSVRQATNKIHFWC